MAKDDAAHETPSEEADARQLELARREGAAYEQALRYMVHDVAHTGGEQRAGDYVIAFAQEKAEGMYVPSDDGSLAWQEPAPDANCHLEVSVRDPADDRFIPGLTVHATVTGADGTGVGPVELPFLWHPGLFHYGGNIALPGDGTYSITVRVEAAPFPRHDRTNGKRYARAEEVTFTDVGIETGRG